MGDATPSASEPLGVSSLGPLGREVVLDVVGAQPVAAVAMARDAHEPENSHPPDRRWARQWSQTGPANDEISRSMLPSARLPGSSRTGCGASTHRSSSGEVPPGPRRGLLAGAGAGAGADRCRVPVAVAVAGAGPGGGPRGEGRGRRGSASAVWTAPQGSVSEPCLAAWDAGATPAQRAPTSAHRHDRAPGPCTCQRRSGESSPRRARSGLPGPTTRARPVHRWG